ncbi:inner membrane protein YgaZ [Paraliobacillus ryukyuensis]|uniref:4-azaleucine resistance transporter AzlC n=1 Tax=Paraliobacillus ryukyuensis TaxID=200904 RepID=A0A366E7D8_9BACI|nr:AzlC family ABC transporter permease [Paraliobacillus ryukyuensis]RBO98283.1 4-azaleucine resistance transporter AzlC [Paraliobacillus ryukyuensis]
MDSVISNKQTTEKMKMMRSGLAAGVPITLGYFPIAITYGVLASQSGISLLELTAMSILVYAGAAQFMGTNMFAIGAGGIEIVFATFVLNFRHFVMSLSFANRTKGITNSWKLPLSLGLTDESFSVASLHTEKAKQEHSSYFYGALMIAAYASWIIGSFIGGVLGDVIPSSLSQSMGIALYAMFIALLIPSVKNEVKYGFIALIAMICNYVFTYYVALAEGWAIVCSTLLASFIGMMIMRRSEGK